MSKRVNPDSVWPVSEGSPLVALFANATSFARCGTNETSQNGMLRSKRPSVLVACFDRIDGLLGSAGFLFRSHTDLGLIGWVTAAQCDRFAPIFCHQRLSQPGSRPKIEAQWPTQPWKSSAKVFVRLF